MRDSAPHWAFSAVLFSQRPDESFIAGDMVQQPTQTLEWDQSQYANLEHSMSCPPTSVPAPPHDYLVGIAHSAPSSTLEIVVCQGTGAARNTAPLPLDPTGTKKRRRGRKRPLTEPEREHAATIRRIGACGHCSAKKAKCDSGSPCKPCIKRFKTALLWNPCRRPVLPDLVDLFFAKEIAWHPAARSPTSFFGPEATVSATEFTVPVTLGFGPAMPEQIRLFIPKNRRLLYHQHVVYQWPPSGQTGTAMLPGRHFVFPGMLSHIGSLEERLEQHLKLLLLEENFQTFPGYRSELGVLPQMHKLYLQLDKTHENAKMLHQALALLVLVHCAGDVTVDSSHRIVQDIMNNIHGLSASTADVTACLIRGQFGAVVPILARKLAKSVLERLYRVTLSQDCRWWPVVLSTFGVLLMVIETMQYHTAKVGFHADHDGNVQNSPAFAYPHSCRPLDEEAVKRLLHLYRHCYGGCHSRLLDPSAAVPQDGFGDFFIALRSAVSRASTYLHHRSTIDLSQINDMSLFFDRLLPQLLLLH